MRNLSIGVITPSAKAFKEFKAKYMRENPNEDSRFIQIQHIEDTRGMVFKSVNLASKSSDMPNLDEIVRVAKLRIV